MIWVLASLTALVAGLLLFAPLLIRPRPLPGLSDASAAATEGSRFLRIPFPGTAGIDLHYLDSDPAAGTDTPCFVLLHGFTFNSFTWDRVFDLFAREGRTIAYDQIPYGLSAKLARAEWSGPNPYSKESAIEQLFALMDALGLGRATLVGNSSGGTLALEAALARPERVERLILVAPWVFVRRPTLSAKIAGLPQMRQLSLFIARKLGRAGLLKLSYARPERIDERRRHLTGIHTRIAGWDIAWGELLNQSLSSPVTVKEHLGAVTQPALLLTGDQDRLVPIADTRKVAAALPAASLAVLPGCGHVPQEECPEAFERVVGEWLAAGGGEARRDFHCTYHKRGSASDG